MLEQFNTKHIISKTGERLKLLVDGSTGVPLYYPNLYITSQIRGAAKSVATIQSFITSLKVLYAWSLEYVIDIESRWVSGEWLNVCEIDSLRDYCSLSLRGHYIQLKKVIDLNKIRRNNVENVDSATKYVRMTFIADYLMWLGEILGLQRLDKDCKAEIVAMHRSIKTHRPKHKGRSNTAREDKGLDPILIKEVLEVTKPGHDNNPSNDHELQIRNALIIALLHYLGIRRGELLNIRVDDIDFITNEIRIIRRADSYNDPRVYQPLVKTEERTLPITDKLAGNISEYVTNIRSTFLRARKHPYLFVTHKAGSYQGMPLSNSGFGKLMISLQHVADNFSGVHAHAFRHSWNYSFSNIIDNLDSETSPGKEEQMRSYLMGWKETSGTAAIYNRRHIKEKAKEAILEFQRGLGLRERSSDAPD